MTCKLCGEAKELRESHIIPEFFYAAIYDSRHRMPLMTTLPGQKSRHVQKGIKEYLLCGDCETRLSAHEGVTKRDLYGELAKPSTVHWVRLTKAAIDREFFGTRRPSELLTAKDKVMEAVLIRSIDNFALRLVILSVIWKSAISTDPFFSRVQLGSAAEAIRRTIHEILYEDRMTIDPEFFGGFAFTLTVRGKFALDVTYQPEIVKLSPGVQMIKMPFGGMMWCNLLGVGDIRAIAGPYAQTDNRLLMQFMELKDIDAFMRFVGKIRSQGREPAGFGKF